MVSSQDGYCSVIAFEPGELGTPFEDDGTLEFPLPKVAAAVAPPSTSSSTAPDATDAAVAAGTGPGTGAPPPLPWSVAAAAAVKSDDTSAGVVSPQVGDKRTAESMTAEARQAGGGGGGSSGGGEPSVAEGGEPQPKKVKKRVAPTLVKPLS